MFERRDYWALVLTLILRLLVPFSLLILSRNLFLIFNQDLFPPFSIQDWFLLNFYGLRFDISALVAFNILFIFFYLFPLPAIYPKLNGFRALFWLFIIINGSLLLFNCIDIIYYRFTLKRSTGDLFSFVLTSPDIIWLVPQFLIDYWYMTLIWLGLVGILAFTYQQIPTVVVNPRKDIRQFLLLIIIWVISAGFIVLGIRGGFQLKPLRPINAVEILGPQFGPVVLNTPFSIMKTFKKETLSDPGYYSPEQLAEHFKPIKNYYRDSNSFKQLNVVLIIMESFSKEYMGPPYGVEGLTPFLDSLAREGLFFQMAFANGKKSMEALPAMISGIPTLMEEPYITSIYSGNQISGLPVLLKRQGYSSLFFHGGSTGTMGFDAYCKLAGFDEYFGREDYPEESDYDGAWGIFDEPFFQYFAQKLEGHREPFFATFFSLSSHHPYPLPPHYKNIFPEGKHPLFKTVSYADYSLKKFFETISKAPWFQRSLFIITADHTAESFDPYFKSSYGNYSIPLLFYCPSDTSLKGSSNKITQQLDILPTVLDYLNYPQDFFSLGESALNPDLLSGFSINYLNQVYQYIEADYALQFNGKKSIGLYNIRSDSSQSENLLTSSPDMVNQLEPKVRMFIQGYNQSLIQNSLTQKNYQNVP